VESHKHNTLGEGQTVAKYALAFLLLFYFKLSAVQRFIVQGGGYCDWSRPVGQNCCARTCNGKDRVTWTRNFFL